jgi:plastocyanin
MRTVRALSLIGLLVVTLAGIWGAVAGSPHGATAAKAAPQHIFIYVFRGHINGKPGVPGADGKGHDTLVPSTFAVKVGTPVIVTVVNYDEGAHSIVAPDLGLNVTIKPGTETKDAKDHEAASEEIGEGVQPVTTTFTFTPTKTGVFRWFCALPCDAGQHGWAMQMGYSGPGKEGAMAGFIVVLKGG